MLRELADIRQTEGRRPRRWFQSNAEDLIVWYAEDGTPAGFQLCYDRGQDERALTWTQQRGYTHHRIDAGEGSALRYKQTPVLVADGTFDATAMSRRFLRVSAGLPREIREFVLVKLAEY
ncbi:MAG: hypothetical protein K0R53_1068, partial [Burkholderiales bacterium]|nr:hypothetical protein [Burkholderiales bacterium]